MASQIRNHETWLTVVEKLNSEGLEVSDDGLEEETLLKVGLDSGAARYCMDGVQAPIKLVYIRSNCEQYNQ